MNPPRVIEIFPFFNLVLGFNKGISFGLLSSENSAAPYLLSIFAIIVVTFLSTLLWRSRHRTEAVGIGCIIGGALANVTDRLADGAVTDFLDFHVVSYHWPTFNIADAAIFCGGVLFVATSYLAKARST